MKTSKTNAMRARISSSSFLWASALVLAALVVIQGGRTGGSEARAEMFGAFGTMTAITIPHSASEDVLLVINERSEELFVYRVENENLIELQRRYSIPRLFADARGQGTGGR